MVTGGSYGGFMTLAVATNYNDRIRCSVDIVGPSNLVTFLENTSGYRRDLRRVEYGDERDPKMRAFLERIAKLAREDTFCRRLDEVERRWLRENASPEAKEWNLLSTLRPDSLRYVR